MEKLMVSKLGQQLVHSMVPRMELGTALRMELGTALRMVRQLVHSMVPRMELGTALRMVRQLVHWKALLKA